MSFLSGNHTPPSCSVLFFSLAQGQGVVKHPVTHGIIGERPGPSDVSAVRSYLLLLIKHAVTIDEDMLVGVQVSRAPFFPHAWCGVFFRKPAVVRALMGSMWRSRLVCVGAAIIRTIEAEMFGRSLLTSIPSRICGASYRSCC